MPATSARPASPRQIAFLRSLVAERNNGQIPADLGVEIETAFAGHPVRRDLIDRVMAVPRSTAVAAPAASTGDQIAPPSAGTRAGRMLLAGGIEATATLADGRHVTVSIRTRKRSGRGWTNAALGEADSRTNISILGSRVGWLNVDADGRLLLTLRTRREDAVAAVRAVLDHCAGMIATGGVDRVQEASRCGRCFRTLTDPVSIDRGIGPECFGRDTGSQHIAAVRVSNADEALAVAGTNRAEVAAEARRRNQAAADAAEERMNALVAQGDREERVRVANAEMEQARQMEALETAADALAIPVRPSLTEVARRVDTRSSDVGRARDLIAEALDSYFGEPELSFALGIFDQLAAR
jgi:hypothetical protein